MAGTRKLLSLDANLVFDLAREKDFAHEFREVFQARGYSLVLPPTAVFELHIIFTQGDSAVDRNWARTALLNLKRWDIHPFDLDSTSEGIAEQFARRLLTSSVSLNLRRTARARKQKSRFTS